MTNRRKFLQLLGVGTASAPMAASHLAEADVMGLAGIKPNRGLAASQGIAEAADEAVHGSPFGSGNAIAEGAKYLRKFGKLPDHVERHIRDRSREVNYLDYDIANKCWSLAVKVQEQRQRNYEREVNRYREGDSYAEAQKAFAAITGFKWPW